ncbi:MAG: hypothetical protein NC089_05955 [Bacteroides sp.]|nr:hypothetical protein [Bacteroides sp.]MCM1550043.1 hypothetical protein [Clostridium sp.]
MKRKYYLRGIGVGILFATIVLFTTYSISGQGKMTDEEVIRRAEELGMIKSGTLLDNLTRPASTEDPSSSSEANPPTTEAEKTEEPSTDEPEPDTETASERPSGPTTEAVDPDARMVSFTVVSGMNSWNVATILQDQGVIADAADFDSYLETNGYSARISTGDYTIAVGSDYETIAKLLTSGE